jgi:hypothetical protein
MYKMNAAQEWLPVYQPVYEVEVALPVEPGLFYIAFFHNKSLSTLDNCNTAISTDESMY